MGNGHGGCFPSGSADPAPVGGAIPSGLLPTVSSTDLQITGDLAVVGVRGTVAASELDRLNAVMREALAPAVRRILVDARAVTSWADGGLELLAAATAQARLGGVDVVVSGLGPSQHRTLRALGRRA